MVDTMTHLTLTLAFEADYKKSHKLSRRLTLESREPLNQFLATIERKAFRMAHIATSNPDDALELVQEAMMKLVEKYHDKTAEEWTPLFYRILSSKINDWYRKQGVRNRWMAWLPKTNHSEYVSDPIENAPDTHQSPLEKTQQDQATDKLLTLLSDLSPRQQQAFLLRAWEGMSVEETAFALGCSSGSVKTHYSRAIHALKDQLEDVY